MSMTLILVLGLIVLYVLLDRFGSSIDKMADVANVAAERHWNKTQLKATKKRAKLLEELDALDEVVTQKDFERALRGKRKKNSEDE
jgi:hypothetical protein